MNCCLATRYPEAHAGGRASKVHGTFERPLRDFLTIPSEHLLSWHSAAPQLHVRSGGNVSSTIVPDLVLHAVTQKTPSIMPWRDRTL